MKLLIIKPGKPGLLLIIFLISGYQSLQSQKTLSREYMLKAVFLFNFTQFVDWPADSFETEQLPLIIGVLGENPFGFYLEEIVRGEKINGHPVVIRYFKNEEDAKECHILFINLNEAVKCKQVIEVLKGKNILTISDVADFSKQGGMVRLFTRDNKIKLLINLNASRETELIFSSKLLRLADIYEPNEIH